MLNAVKDTNIDEKEVRDLCQAMLKKSQWKTLAGILKALKNNEPEKIRRAVLGYMSAVLLNSGDANAALIIDCFSSPTYNTGFPGIILATFYTLE